MAHFLEDGISVLKREGTVSFIGNFIKFIAWRVLGDRMIADAMRKYQQSVVTLSTIEEFVDFAYSFDFCGLSIRPFQVKNELILLMKRLEEMKPKVIVEIGTAKGGTLFLLAKASHPESLLVSIDLPGGPFGGGYPSYMAKLFQSFSGERQRIVLIRGNSHEVSTRNAVLDALSHQSVDFMLIDGDHSYEGVKKDYELYGPMLKRGGVVAFHDIQPGLPEKVGGVPDFWREVGVLGSCERIVGDDSQMGYGIGLLRVGESS